MAAQWEVVGKSSTKRSKNPPKALTKAEKKAFVEKLQRKEPYGKARALVPESPNTYSAFIDDEAKDMSLASLNRGYSVNAELVGNGQNMNGGSGQSKKLNKAKKSVEKIKGPITLECGLAQIDVSDVEVLLQKDQMTFPDNPLLWLKDLASFLNIKLDTVPEMDPAAYEKQVADFPLCEVPKPITKMLHQVLDATNSAVLELFYEHCINSMVSDIAKGASTYGYRIFIQLLAHKNPNILKANLSRYLELIKTNQNRQSRCLSIMWAIGQPGVKSLSCGLRTWIDIMFPLLAIRPLSFYSVIYLENIFAWHSDMRSANDVINFRDFFPIFDVIYAGSGSLPSMLQKRLLVVYPKIKAVAFTDRADVTLRNFFPSFLARLSENAAEPMKTELINCLITCLSQDKHCFSLWRQMYTRHFTQSGFLLRCLADDYSHNAMRVDIRVLIDTVKTFNVTNEDLASQKKTNFDGYNQCNEACERLLFESSKFHIPWMLILMTSLSVITALVVSDLYFNNGKFKGCKTQVFLEQSGAFAFCAQVGARSREYSVLALRWAEVNVPLYYSKTVENVGPYLVYFCEKLVELRDYLFVVSAPARAWILAKSLALFAWLQINIPVWYSCFIEHATPVWEVCSHFIQLAWREIVIYSTLVWAWLQENVLVGQFSLGNLHRLSVESLLILRQYLTQFITWCGNIISNLISN